MNKLPPIPDLPEEEKTPVVKLLLAFIEQQQQVILQQQEEIDNLKAEVARLKKLPPKPNIKPSKLPKDDDNDNPTGHSSNRSGKKGQQQKRRRKSKRTIHKSKIIQPDNLPQGSRFLGYQNFDVQDLLIQPNNTRYRLARYQTPDGNYCIGKLPASVAGKHFGQTLQSYILYQYYHQRVTQRLIKIQLEHWGIDISTGQIQNILIDQKQAFHDEKNELLTAGLQHSRYIHVDDTGSRHQGRNGYCTHIGNEQFAWFASTPTKSRINFLQLLRGSSTDYVLGNEAFHYMIGEKLPKDPLLRLQAHADTVFYDEQQWQTFLSEQQISQERHIRIATEGALLGALKAKGFPSDLVIMSDDAGQFDVLLHTLCWIHTDRVFLRLLPLNETHVKELDWVHTQIWEIFSDLKQYKLNPNAVLKISIESHFDELCQTQTSYQSLNLALRRLAKNKKELLLVLERPDIPLHNNLSENDIREYVIKRKISGTTRSENGRMCRDTFLSFIKTCFKQGISFWEFIVDRIANKNLIPLLPDLLAGKVCLIS